ncbi:MULTISPECIES: metalloregulator ArsR/SmtB family transcription factor [unclassified Polaromonas]|jgi:rhodanese-related sulfurtransferase/DNA-binding CsgD family transcriptional regulator|uniref:ArsR/SmtB family transcription factor n=1 Tax=unclassified Polaromonas TaxID=2638319 RepID=UPI000BC5C21B|nr:MULTISPECIES: metalloregulator ArsR/SmtB family transcription factor [unclassified Polaromonas]OYY35305.1 MAG: ArsR family transcriptional regulator [Polaromonas sp. 35-63-35]OYZ19089.1 MAG: ArsR family transcriptional regulator [Polaromonas sp. 16-63-31]OYZ78188.1 MAG: ArsR family transcriptional regulator [Polaromonas sp. 24-63-21]OZA48746.1 MAG: ArsR family transcriptional regulator [Polaromonas sp. 17-63-33]OZA87633.1 MAG: ArsR family transcriptional regulator [Polaromonas sp. 39-63-25]
MRHIKDHLYEQVARIGKAVASPKRLELIELLCQGEKTVEVLAAQAEISVKLASAHLKQLRMARLVDTRKEGKYVLYRLASTSVADLWVNLRAEAEERLVELQVALASIVEHGDELEGIDRAAIMKKAKSGEVLVLDVRPEEEFASAHLPHARSLPVDELRKRLKELPKDVPVVAYCRGPFCLMARDAVELLRKQGYRAFHLTDGVAEWRARGLPIEQTS